jgi:hypothetical protein
VQCSVLYSYQLSVNITVQCTVYSTVKWSVQYISQYSTVQYSAVQYSTVQYISQCSAVQCSAVLCSAVRSAFYCPVAAIPAAGEGKGHPASHTAQCGKAAFKGQEKPILDTSGQKFSWVRFTFLEVVLQLGFRICKGPGGMFGHCQNIPGRPGMPGN